MRGHSMLSAACCPDMLDFPLLSALGSSTTHLLLAFGVGLTLPYWVNLHDNRHRAVLLLATFALAMRYMWWRGTETLAPAGLTFDMLASYSLFAFELLAMVGTVSSYVIMSRIRLRSQEADTHAQWWGEDEPRVAILIATYNEDLDILERTIVGARALRHRNKEVLVLDDSRRDWLRDYCAGQGVRYMRRPDNKGSKAGNINHCLDRLAEDPIPPDFVAVLDADFVPHRGFISRCLALFHDPDVGLVQTPQHFFNAVLSMTVLDCIELPRRERHIADLPDRAILVTENDIRRLWISSLTIDEARLRGKEYPIGTEGTLRLRDIGDVPAAVIAPTVDGCRVRLLPTVEQREALLVRFYAEGAAPGTARSQLGGLLAGLGRSSARSAHGPSMTCTKPSATSATCSHPRSAGITYTPQGMYQVKAETLYTQHSASHRPWP